MDTEEMNEIRVKFGNDPLPRTQKEKPKPKPKPKRVKGRMYDKPS